MEVHRLEREFVYNGVKLPDTTPTMTPEQVRETYTHLYPEIATAIRHFPVADQTGTARSLSATRRRKGDLVCTISAGAFS